MIIGVLSDTHGNLTAVKRAFDLFREYGVDTVFHLGDGVRDVKDKGSAYNMTVITVSGNMDFDKEAPLERVYQAGDFRFFLCHGHTLMVKETIVYLLQRAREQGCQAALFGHSHIPCNVIEKGILLLNPGSTTRPKGGNQASAAIINTEGNLSAEIFWLWEENRVFSRQQLGDQT